MTVRSSLRNALASSAIRSAGVLVGGTAVAQALTVLVLPLLTRLYSPTDFTILAVYSGIVAIFAYAATGRFDLAIALPEADTEAINLLVLSVVCSFATSVLISIAFFLFGRHFAQITSLEQAEPYFWLIPISIFLGGSFFGLQNWWVRRKSFKALATTRVQQTLGGLSVQAGMGVLGLAPIGLLLGQLLISGAGSYRLMRDFWRRDLRLLRAVNLHTLKLTAYKNREFPKYSIADALAANAGEQLPMILIAALSGPTAGLLYLTMRVVGAPVQLISGAVSQVFLSRVGKSHQEGRLHLSTEKLVTALLRYGATPLLFCSIAMSPMFGIVFGDRWSGAGAMLMWVAPWFALRLMVFPLLAIPAVAGKQRDAMFTRMASLIGRVAAVYIGFYYWDGRVIQALALANVAHWVAMMVLCYRIAGVRFRSLGMSFFALPVAAILLGWTVSELILALNS